MTEFKHATGTYKGTDVMEQLRAKLPEIKKKLRDENLRATKEAIKARVQQDDKIVNVINTIETLDKVANSLAKRFRDWFALYNPELEHKYTDHKELVDSVLERCKPSEDSMGGTFSEADLAILKKETILIQSVYQQREHLLQYLEETMKEFAPNLTEVAGSMIGAKLIALAGGMKRLAMLPSGTVQLLGAETALFRHLKNKSARPPKHGIIFNHRLLQQAQRKKHGKIARALADNISIAARVDYFKGEFVGKELLKKVETVVNR